MYNYFTHVFPIVIEEAAELNQEHWKAHGILKKCVEELEDGANACVNISYYQKVQLAVLSEWQFLSLTLLSYPPPQYIAVQKCFTWVFLIKNLALISVLHDISLGGFYLSYSSPKRLEPLIFMRLQSIFEQMSSNLTFAETGDTFCTPENVFIFYFYLDPRSNQFSFSGM